MSNQKNPREIQIMREVLFHVAQRGGAVMKPLAGEGPMFDKVLRVLAFAGVVAYEWNPAGDDGKKIVGTVGVALTAHKLLEVFNPHFTESEVVADGGQPIIN